MGILPMSFTGRTWKSPKTLADGQDVTPSSRKSIESSKDFGALPAVHGLEAHATKNRPRHQWRVAILEVAWASCP